LGPGMRHLHGGRAELERRVPETVEGLIAASGDLVPGSTASPCLTLRSCTTGVGQRVDALAFDLLARDQAFFLEHLQRGVDGPRAPPPRAAGTPLQLLDHLVSVHRLLGEQCQDGRTDVAAPSSWPRSPGTAETEAKTSAESPWAPGSSRAPRPSEG